MMVATDICPDCGMSLVYGDHASVPCGSPIAHEVVGYVVLVVWSLDGTHVENTSTVAANRLYAHLAVLVDEAPVIELHVTGIQHG